MRKTLLLIFILFYFLPDVFSQNLIGITGTVKSSDNIFLSNATVTVLQNNKDSISKTTDEKGRFNFSGINADRVTLKISFVGFSDYVKEFDFKDKIGEQQLGEFLLTPAGKMLENITLESQKIQIKEDTVSYLIDSTMYRKNDNVESLLKKLPGVQVDRDGSVTAQGKQVTKVKVNGKDFFNGDVTTATRELNADMVDRIQIIDDYGDQSAFTGIKDGDPSKTLNIQLRKDKNKGYFGNATAGAGTEQRYIGSLSVNKFNNNQQLSVYGNINNTNANLFNFGSVGGAFGNMANSMARSMGVGRGGGGFASTLGNFGVADGISLNKSLGVNYRDEWGAKVSVYGSYSFSDKQTNTIKTTSQENLFQGNITNFIQQSNNNTISDNHRFSFNLEYKIDSANYLKITPGITYNKNISNVTSDFVNNFKGGIINSDGSMIDNTRSETPNFTGSLLFNHRFRKKGRTLSLNLNSGLSNNEADDAFENLTNFYVPNGLPTERKLIQQIVQDNKNENWGVKTSYTEPLNKKQQLEFNYNYTNQFISNDRRTINTDPVTAVQTLVDSSTNIYTNDYGLNRFGVNFRTTEKKYNYTVGMAVQPATITTNSISGNARFVNNIINYYPVIRFAYNFSRSRALNINYNGSTNQPGNLQLQPVVDKSNPQFITIGNPNLRPEFTSTFSMRYNNFDFIKGNVFFGNITASFTRDKIVNNIKLLRGGVQETRYLNANGFFTILGFYNISKPIQNRKYVFTLGGNITYNNNISFLTNDQNEILRNIGQNWLIAQRFSTDIKIKKWLETNLSVNYSLNSSKYSLQKELNLNTNTWVISNSTKVFLPYDFNISCDLDKTFNSGFAGNVNANSFIINGSLEKAFLNKKNLSVKLQAYDILNQNLGISRSVAATGFTDIRTNRLARYFMISLVYRLNKFFGDQPGMQMGFPGGGGMRMMGGGNNF